MDKSWEELKLKLRFDILILAPNLGYIYVGIWLYTMTTETLIGYIK